MSDPLAFAGRLILACSAVLVLVSCSEQEPAAQAPGESSEFLRFVKEEGSDRAWLQTSIVRYEDDRRRRVDLVGAVHIGEPSYYELLDRVFLGYEAVLYELVAEESYRPSPGQGGGSWLTALQHFLKNSLELSFQLDEVDYTAENFVHADLDPKTFQRLQEEQGESILLLMLRVMLQSARQPVEDLERQSALNLQMLLAMFSKDRAYAMKYLLGEQFGDLEKMAAGFEVGPGGGESVLIGKRNEKAIEVLRRELKKGKKKLAIFYGAAHMPDFERRLCGELGFHKVSAHWIPAWTIERRGDSQ